MEDENQTPTPEEEKPTDVGEDVEETIDEEEETPAE